MIRFCIVLGISFLVAQIAHGFRPVNRFSCNHASKYQLQAANGMDIGRPALKQLAGVLLGAGLLSSPMQSFAATKSAAPSTSSTVTTAKPSEKIKLAEEIAYDGAIERKNANKARQQALKTEIKDSKSKISLLGNEIKRLDSQLLGIERKLEGKTANTDMLKRDQAEAIKKLGDKRVELGSEARKVERDETELKSLERRYPSDEAAIKTKQEELKKKREQLKQEAEKAKRKQLEKEANEARKVQKKAQDELGKAQKDAKSVKRSLDDAEKRKSNDAKAVSERVKKVEELEKALVSAKSAAVEADAKVKADEVKVAEFRSRLSSEEARVKADEAALKTATAKYEQAASKVKK